MEEYRQNRLLYPKSLEMLLGDKGAKPHELSFSVIGVEWEARAKRLFPLNRGKGFPIGYASAVKRCCAPAQRLTTIHGGNNAAISRMTGIVAIRL